MAGITKEKKVQNHLIEYGSITSWEAIKEYSATRLSAIIWNLRNKKRMNIVSKKEQHTDKYGDKTYFSRYYYERENQDV